MEQRTTSRARTLAPLRRAAARPSLAAWLLIAAMAAGGGCSLRGDVADPVGGFGSSPDAAGAGGGMPGRAADGAACPPTGCLAPPAGTGGGVGAPGTGGSPGGGGAAGGGNALDGRGGNTGGNASAGPGGGPGGVVGTGAADAGGPAPMSGTDGGSGADGGGDAPGGGGCRGLDESACRARGGCMVASCPRCDGGAAMVAVACVDPVRDNFSCPSVACGPTAIAPCEGLGEAACKARPECSAQFCPGCQGNVFSRCTVPGVAPVACPVIECPKPCADVTTELECEARTDCHSVFVDPGTCGCAAVGCCARFQRCAGGDKAMCRGTPACDALAPFCEGPAFVVSYTNACYEGCVRAKDCIP
jgi:hypothetical protein